MKTPSYQELLERTDAPRGSAWNIFGANDEYGTVNFLTPERVLAAAKCVRQGKQFNLDCALDTFKPPTSHQRKLPKHTIFGTHPHQRDDFLDSFYLQGSSQIDALRHMRHPRYGFYNGTPDERITVGGRAIGIGRWAERGGMVGRGVLLDLERHYRLVGKPIDQRSAFAIPVGDLEVAAKTQGVEIRKGDILLLRTGWLKFYLQEMSLGERADFPKQLKSPGLLQSHETLAWLWDHQISVCAADNPGVEAIPPDPSSPFADEVRGLPGVMSELQAGLMHPNLIALLGLVLGELWDLESLAHDCESDGVWECLVTIKPLNLTGGVGSPANAIAVK